MTPTRQIGSWLGRELACQPATMTIALASSREMCSPWTKPRGRSYKDAYDAKEANWELVRSRARMPGAHDDHCANALAMDKAKRKIIQGRR